MILSVHSANSSATFAHSSLWRPFANSLHAPVVHKNTEARNSRRCSCYPRNATAGAWSGFAFRGYHEDSY